MQNFRNQISDYLGYMQVVVGYIYFVGYMQVVVIDSSRLHIESVFVELKLFYECESEVLAKDK